MTEQLTDTRNPKLIKLVSQDYKNKNLKNNSGVYNQHNTANYLLFAIFVANLFLI